MPIQLLDAPGRALSFLISQQMVIEPTVYAFQYQEIQYPMLVPVDTTAPEWIGSVGYMSSDAVGRAKWFSGGSQDVPHADTLRELLQVGVQMAAIGYSYNLEELNRTAYYGINLSNDKANAARRAAEEFTEKVAMTGDSSKNFTGLVNNATVTTVTAAATGTGSTTTFSTKTPDNVLADVNAALTGIYTVSRGVEMADTLLMPYQQLMDLSTRRIDATNQTTILEWIEKNNVYTRMTGQQLMIRGVWGLETAGAGSTARMVAYKRDPSVVKMHVPMPFRFLPAWQTGPMLFEVPGIMRLGGVDFKRPRSARYVDGI